MKWVSGAAAAVASFVLAAGAPAPAAAEIRLVVPTPRTTMDALTLFPCGTIPRSATPTRFESGQSFTVTWQETTDRDGTYAIALSLAGDRNFDAVLADGIADRTGGGTYMQMVTLPAVTCADCTLQLAQLTTMGTPPTTFYSCADLIITTPAGTDGGPVPPGGDAGTSGMTPGSDGGCGCATARRTGHAPLALTVLATLGVLARVRRRTRR